MNRGLGKLIDCPMSKRKKKTNKSNKSNNILHILQEQWWAGSAAISVGFWGFRVLGFRIIGGL